MLSAVERAEEQFKGKDDQYVIDTYTGCHDSINNTECFGSKDVILYALAETELFRRGYTISEVSQLEIRKAG